MPLTPFSPVAAHAQEPQPDEAGYQQLVEMMKSDPNQARLILSKLRPNETQGFSQFMNTYMKGGSQDAQRAKVGIGGSDDVTPALGGAGLATGFGSAGAAAGAAGSKAATSVGSGIGKAARSPMGQWAALELGSKLMPPGAARSMMEMFGMMRGMGMGGGAAEKAVLTDEELVQQMRERGSKLGTRVEPALRPPSRSVGAELGDPPNLQRQGNLTNPGPYGPGSPSTPSIQKGGIPDSAGAGYGYREPPFTNAPGEFKGPLGRPENYTTIPSRPQTGGEAAGADELGKILDQLYGPDAPSKGNGLYRTGPAPGEGGYAKGHAVKIPAQLSMDEADKRKIMFGGAGDQSDPHDRTPIKKATLRKPGK